MNIPNHLKSKYIIHSNNKWFALSKRARIVAISKERVSKNSIKRIEDLSDTKWKGKIIYKTFCRNSKLKIKFIQLT